MKSTNVYFIYLPLNQTKKQHSVQLPFSRPAREKTVLAMKETWLELFYCTHAMIKKIVMLEMTKQIFPTKKWLSKETKTLRDDDNQTKKNQLLQKKANSLPFL